MAPESSQGERAASDRAGLLRRRVLAGASLAVTVLALGLALWLALTANKSHNPPWVDWATYSNALQRLADHLAVYDPRQLSGPYRLLDMSTGGAFGYAYPPASLILFLPFWSQPLGLTLWLGLNVGLLVSGAFAVLRRELGRDAALYFGVAILPVILWVGFIEGLTAGNVTVGLSGVLAWAWAIGRERVSPFAVAALGIAKVFPATLVFWTTPSRLPRAIATSALIAAIWVVATLPFIGVGTWLDFFRAMGNAQPNCDAYRTSVTCVLAPTIGVSLAKVFAVLLAGTLGLASVFVRRDLIAFTLLALSWVVPAYNQSYYSILPLFVVWVVAFAIAMRRLRSIDPGTPRAAFRRLTSRPSGQSGR